MSAFLVADVEVHDMEHYQKSGYIKEVPIIAAKYGGRYLVRGGDMNVLEGDWEPIRMVIIQFPDQQKLDAFYECEEYAPYKKIRQSITTSKIIKLVGLQEQETENISKGVIQ